MSNFASFARRCATGLVAAQLMFGALTVTAVVVSAPAQAATVMDQHGAWQGFSTTIDGRRLFGAITRMDRGGTAAFLVKDGGLSLFMTDPSWRLVDGKTMAVRLTIDGQSYTGTGIARGGDMIEMADVKRDVLTMFVDGAEAQLDVNSGDYVWTLDLHGFTASMADALRLVRA